MAAKTFIPSVSRSGRSFWPQPFAAGVRDQRLRKQHTAIGLLAGLQNCGHGAAYSQSAAIEGVHQARGLAVLGSDR